jgi:hypothetical protein
MSRQLWAGAVPSVQAGGRVNTQPNPLSPRCSKVPRVPETKGRLSSVRCDETQRDCRAVLPPRPRRTALSKQCCILHSAGSQAIEKTTSRSSEVQNKRCVCCTPDRRWRGETGCRAPRGQPTVVDGWRSTARVFLSFLFFSFQPRLTRQKSGLATVLGEACGVDDSLTIGLGACLQELFPAVTKSPADMVWHVHFDITDCR